MDWFAGTQGAASAVRGREAEEAPPPVPPAVAWWRAECAAQGPRRFAWGAVAFITGLMGYFALPVEPPLAAAGLLAAVCALVWWLHRAGRAHVLAGLTAMAIAGMAWGQLHVALNPVTVLPASTGKLAVAGWVEAVSPLSRSRARLLLLTDRVDGLKPAHAPQLLRLTGASRDLSPLVHGQYVRLEAWLYPPLTPVQPGAWDHGRASWFEGAGGNGRVAGGVVIDPALGKGAGWRGWVEALRTGIAARIRASLPEREAGFAVALVTGERAGLDNDTRDALQVSGLAHILAISGLHMSLVAGGVFWLVRALLALWPALVLNWPVKKLAALAGLGAAAFYLLISGQAIATQRAFIMLGVMFVAVLLGRSALSMRNLAVAAFIVLLMSPEAVLTPSFQMSFLAVTGLIGAYEAASGWQSRLYERLGGGGMLPGLALRLLVGLLALSATTIIASAFTALPAAWHFNRFAVWSLPANLLAMPAVSLLVMPGAVAGVLAMPFGLEWLPLQVMRLGLDAVIWSAHWVASWPGAASVVGAMWPLPAVLSGLGLIWLALWRGLLRWAGLAVSLLAAWAGVGLSARPDVLVERSARTIAARVGEDGQHLVPVHPRRSRYVVERWLGADGDAATPPQAFKRGGWSCEGEGAKVCRGQVRGRRIIWLDRDARPPADCRTAPIVISAEPLRRACGRTGGGRVVIDRFDVWRHGAHALFIGADGSIEVRTVRQAQGNRPWAMRPMARREVLGPPDGDDDGGDDAAGNGQ